MSSAATGSPALSSAVFAARNSSSVPVPISRPSTPEGDGNLQEVKTGDLLAKQSDVTVGGNAVPPETEYFGFALYVGSTFVFILYLLWAFLPKKTLNFFNIYYYPSRWWALALPSFLIVALIYTYIALACYDVEILTRPLASFEIVTDSNAKVVDDPFFLTHPSDGVWDLSLSEVSRVLYND